MRQQKASTWPRSMVGLKNMTHIIDLVIRVYYHTMRSFGVFPKSVRYTQLDRQPPASKDVPGVALVEAMHLIGYQCPHTRYQDACMQP